MHFTLDMEISEVIKTHEQREAQFVAKHKDYVDFDIEMNAIFVILYNFYTATLMIAGQCANMSVFTF